MLSNISSLAGSVMLRAAAGCGAIGTPAVHLNDRPLRMEAGRRGGRPHAVGDRVVVEVERPPAIVADQKDAVVHAARVEATNRARMR